MQTTYQELIKYSALKHGETNQKMPDSELPYVVHLSNVAMEVFVAHTYDNSFDLKFAVSLALLHDVLEDTSATYKELKEKFGIDIADGVLALTKNTELPKEERMQDSLNRIKQAQKEVAIIKLADRITNLQQPPTSWGMEKKLEYLAEAKFIYDNLKGKFEYFEKRLYQKIEDYKKYTISIENVNLLKRFISFEDAKKLSVEDILEFRGSGGGFYFVYFGDSKEIKKGYGDFTPLNQIKAFPYKKRQKMKEQGRGVKIDFRRETCFNGGDETNNLPIN